MRTGKGDVGIKFIDDTNVAVSAHSSLVIDEFIYDPNSKTGSKLVMNIASRNCAENSSVADKRVASRARRF